MFTGLVQALGRVSGSRLDRGTTCLSIEHSLGELALGESIAVDGACLTVTKCAPGTFSVDASEETLRCTTLGGWTLGTTVHLERALRAGEPLGGHFVTGHVDGIGRLVEKTPAGESLQVLYEVPSDLARFLAQKGSIAIDGVSLTVNQVDGTRFFAMLIPFTLGATKLGATQIGQAVNIEVDVLARYVQRQLDLQSK